jgi:hypothetical protein
MILAIAEGAGEAVGRPGHRVVSAVLAEGGTHAGEVVARLPCQGHQPGGQVSLVVRVRPDAEDGAERAGGTGVGDEGGAAHGPAAIGSAGGRHGAGGAWRGSW